MIKLIDLLKENSSSTYNYGCVMLYFNFPQLKKIQSNIDENEIYTEEGDKTYGLEDEPHITLLYGLHEEVTPDQVKKIVNNFEFESKGILLDNISCFVKDKYDVLKLDAKGKILHEINKELKTLSHTSDYPKYNPHLTICYLKPGIGKIYSNGFKGLKFEAFPSKIIYNQPNGEKTEIKRIEYGK